MSFNVIFLPTPPNIHPSSQTHIHTHTHIQAGLTRTYSVVIAQRSSLELYAQVCITIIDTIILT
jgi:hypothetical protein